MAKDSKPKGYPPGEVERFANARNLIYGENIRGLVALKLDSKVSMRLQDYEAIGREMSRLRAEVESLRDSNRGMSRTITAVRTAVS